MKRMLTGLLILIAAAATVQGADDKVLVYTRNGKGFVHDNIAASVACLKELGAENGFGVEVSEDPAVFTDANLKQYRAIVFSNSNNEAFDTEEQKTAFQRYIRGGGGFVGIHSSTGSERQWPWFWAMQGAKFYRHAPLQKFTINVVDREHPSTAFLDKTWAWEDEPYGFTEFNPKVRVLLALDGSTVNDKQKADKPYGTVNGLMPLAWCHEFEGGRSFYTGLGHKIEYYKDPALRRHILGGIRWAMGTAANP